MNFDSTTSEVDLIELIEYSLEKALDCEVDGDECGMMLWSSLADGALRMEREGF